MITVDPFAIVGIMLTVAIFVALVAFLCGYHKGYEDSEHAHRHFELDRTQGDD
jgi:hypothetical protein